jgi:predicted MPP superfamily phosphohydrolase
LGKFTNDGKYNIKDITMKRVFSVSLIVILISFLCLPLVSCSQKPDYDYAFITDLHVVANSRFTKENYSSYLKRQKLLHVSEAILNSLVDELIEKDYKYVFVGGDITEFGDEESHLVAAAAFSRLEKAKCQVYVINGNHDLPMNKGEIGRKISPTRFREIYKDFGYDQAIESSPNTLSYVANINKKYRLIGLDDMVHYGENDVDVKPDAMTDANIRWMEAQVDKCNEDEVTPIIIAHDTLIDHYPPIAQAVLNRTANNMFQKLTKRLADKCAKYVFAGHDHVQDINVIETEKGNSLYEVATASMTLYPLSYREMSFNKKKVTINTCSFDKLNIDYLPEVCPDSLKEELKLGLQSYCYTHFYDYVYDLVANSPTMLTNMSMPSEVKEVANIFANGVVAKVANNPFYIKDENNNMSLERILQPYGINLPNSSYKNIADLAPYMVMKLLGGDENLVGAPELDLIKYTVFGIFYYFNEQKQPIAELLPKYPINVDLDKLFEEGILECYDSNLMPFGIEFVFNINETIGKLLKNFISNFDKLSDPFIMDLISGATNGIVSDLDEYFVGKNLLLGKFIDEGVWGVYGKEYVLDNPPSDTYLEIIVD